MSCSLFFISVVNGKGKVTKINLIVFSYFIQAQSTVLSSEARNAAAEIEQRLKLGSKLSDVVNNKGDVLALFNLYRDEGYILTEHKGRFCVSILAALF